MKDFMIQRLDSCSVGSEFAPRQLKPIWLTKRLIGDVIVNDTYGTTCNADGVFNNVQRAIAAHKSKEQQAADTQVDNDPSTKPDLSRSVRSQNIH